MITVRQAPNWWIGMYYLIAFATLYVAFTIARQDYDLHWAIAGIIALAALAVSFIVFVLIEQIYTTISEGWMTFYWMIASAILAWYICTYISLPLKVTWSYTVLGGFAVMAVRWLMQGHDDRNAKHGWGILILFFLLVIFSIMQGILLASFWWGTASYFIGAIVLVIVFILHDVLFSRT